MPGYKHFKRCGIDSDSVRGHHWATSPTVTCKDGSVVCAVKTSRSKQNKVCRSDEFYIEISILIDLG